MLVSSLIFSQEHEIKEKIEKQVNTQLWKPFKKSFENRDAIKYNDLHTDDVIRVNKWGIKVGEDFKKSNLVRYNKKDNIVRTIDLWFEHRLYNDNCGYEVGYYRIKSKSEEGNIKEHYARFHVVLKKVNGKWKIAQDWDTTNINDVPITNKDFQKGTPLAL